jgi:alcohol dehydrogenase class IV
MSWLSKIDFGKVVHLRTKTDLFFGCGAIQKFEDICKELANRNINKLLIIAGKNSYKTCGAWDVIEPIMKKHNIEYTLFNEMQPNPIVDDVEKAVEIGIKFGAKGIVAIGGGSPIDAAKAVSVLINYPNANLYDLYTHNGKFPEEKKCLPIIAINTTHGTGTEVNRFSVITFPKTTEKLGTGVESFYPLYSIDDPNLLKKLPLNQTLYTSLDAVNHATESATSKINSPYSILLAKETIRLVAKYLPIVVKDPSNEEARYYLHYASAIAGISIDNAACHLTHSLEHPLSAIKQELAHGLGLTILLPAVLQEIYASSWEILIDIYEPILPKDAKWGQDLKKEAVEFAKIVEDWIFSLNVKEKLKEVGFTKKDLEVLVPLGINMCKGTVAPIEATEEVIRRIYENSFEPMP